MGKSLRKLLILVAMGTLCNLIPPVRSQMLEGTGRTPAAICGSPVFADPSVIPRAISNTKSLHPATYRLMESRAKETISAVAQDTIGMVEQFFVYNFVSSSYYTVSAILMAKGSLTEIWVDKTELADGHVDTSVVRSIQNALENQTPQGSDDPNEGIVKLEENYFGMPPNSGVSNGYVHFLITDIKDGWDSAKSNSSYIAGFFLSNDQPDPSTGKYSYGSNKRDMLYIDSYPGIYHDGTRDPGAPLPTLAHEFQHLIHWHYDPNEVTFLNEGCSTNAEVVCGYPMRSPALYFNNTNVPLFTWHSSSDPAVLADYSRATIYIRYLFEQFGDVFAKDFVENPAEGIAGINSTLAEVGSTLNFNQVFQNWVIANALNDTTVGRQYGYSYPITARPTPSKTFADPNVCAAQDTTTYMAVTYLDFPSGDSLIVSYYSAGLDISAIESGNRPRIQSLPPSTTFYEPGFGSTYKDITFSLLNVAGAGDANISLSGIGKVKYVLKEISYDRGMPDTLDGATFLGFPNNRQGSGWAVKFMPASPTNQLVKAELFVAFAQEFTGSTVPANAPKQFIFHVWGNNNGMPGQDLITPFTVQVNRSSFDETYFDVDLTSYASELTNLQGSIFVGFTEDDTLSTSVGLNHQTSTNYSFAYSPTDLGGWVPISNLNINTTAGKSVSLSGWNLMMRAVFDYPTISSSPPRLTVGIEQGTSSPGQLSVICVGDSALRPESLCGTLAQPGGATQLTFTQVTPTEFIANNATINGDGISGVSIKAAKLLGANYADTSFTFRSTLVTSNVATPLVSPDSLFRVTVPPSPNFYYATLYKGTTDSIGSNALYIYSIGPKGKLFYQQVEIQLDSASFDTSIYAPAIYRGSHWYGLPVSLQNGSLVTSTTYFSTFAIVPRDIIDTVSLPATFALYQNFPNPFNPATTIVFDLPAKSPVRLQVFDILGREIANLSLGTLDGGEHQTTFNALKYGLATGVYFYRLTAGSYVSVKKMMLMK